MVRKHGWQLPAHTFQVIAVTVFCLLVVAFYAFFAPFLGGQIWEYVLIGVYSPAALLVFILYVRSTAINPADPGIMFKFDPESMQEAREKSERIAPGLTRKSDEGSNGTHLCSSSASRSSFAGASSNKKGSVVSVKPNAQVQPRTSSVYHFLEVIFCGIFVHHDCRKQYESDDPEGMDEDALYCTLCNAEVRKFSKHCRSCDKCVDGFDHHCRWLNNCVGQKNYATFISLMAVSLVWLVIEVGVGIAVLVRCFVNKSHMESEIIDKLGNGFTRAPFATVVALCTAVSLLACVPLVELFFFHMILIRKGITTFEYVMAMKAMSEPPASVDEELPSILYSPSGSATTGFSGGSSLGLQYKGAWCTPPRVFVDYQEEVAPQLGPETVPSTVDPDKAQKPKKKAVKISAWKLAKLDSNEAMKAAAKARASSSVLRPLNNNNRRLTDSELSSSENASIQSSMSSTGGNKDARNDFKLSSPLDEYEAGTQSPSSFSSPTQARESVTLSPLPRQTHSMNTIAPNFKVLGFDERIAQMNSGVAVNVQTGSLIRDVTRTSVVWDQEAGRYVSVAAVSASEGRKKTTLPSISAAMPVAKTSVGESEKVMYSGESIFFGGPLLSGPMKGGLKREGESSSRDGQGKMLPMGLGRDSRFKRDAVSNQLPIFTPGGNFGLNTRSGSGMK